MGPSAHKILCVPLKSEVFISLSPVGLLQLSSIDLQRQMLWELIFPVQDPWAREPNVGLRILTLVGEALQYKYSLVCGWPTWGGYGTCLYIASTPCTCFTVVPSLCL